MKTFILSDYLTLYNTVISRDIFFFHNGPGSYVTWTNKEPTFTEGSIAFNRFPKSRKPKTLFYNEVTSIIVSSTKKSSSLFGFLVHSSKPYCYILTMLLNQTCALGLIRPIPTVVFAITLPPCGNTSSISTLVLEIPGAAWDLSGSSYNTHSKTK